MSEKLKTKIEDKKYVISISSGGLGNRLKCLISILRLGEYLKRTPLLYWPKDNNSLGGNFSDLFNLDIEKINKEDLEKLDKKDCIMYKDWLYNIHSDKKYLILTTWRLISLPYELPKKFSKVYPTERGNNIDFEFDRVPKQIRKDILSYLKKIKIKKDIKEKIDRFEDKNNIKECIGIHVRRKDFLDAKVSQEGRGSISSDEDFFKRMEEILEKNPEEKFFLCTDSKETEKKFLKKFKKRIILFPKKTKRDKYNRDIKEALIDLLLLSRTKHILGTYLSTFTEMAWWFGGCKARVEIMGDYKIKEKREVISKIQRAKNPLLKRIFKRIIILLTPKD